MNYAIPYTIGCSEEAEEYIIYYKDNIPALRKFIEGYSEKTIVIKFDEYPTEESIKIANDYDNVILCCSFGKKIDCRFMFKEVARDWEMLHLFLDYGVSAVRIGGDLCFELDKVKEVCKPKGVEVRVPLFMHTYAPPLYEKNFFIRAEAIDIYDVFIDTLELIEQDKNLLQMFKRGKTIDKIYNIPESIYIAPVIWEQRRVSCGRSCLKGGGCRLCENMTSLANRMKDNGFKFE